MLSPLPRRSDWASVSLIPSSRISLPRKGCRVGLRIVLFEACSAFTRVAACTLALSPMRDTLIEGFSHFVSSMTAPIASGWSGCRVGLAPTGKRRLVTAHTRYKNLWAIARRPLGSDAGDVLSLNSTPILFTDPKWAEMVAQFCHPNPREEAKGLCWVPSAAEERGSQ
jgi:hypothetical protein